MPRKGLPAKYAKHGFKKGWKLYRAAQAATARKRRSSVSGTARKPSTGARKMPARKKTRAVTVAKPRARRRPPRLLSQATINTVLDGLVIGTAAIGSTVAVNKTPKVKDLNLWLKVLAQAGTGIVIMSASKEKLLKKAGMGMLVGSAISGVLPFMPKDMKVFGRRRRFSSGELNKLQTVGRPSVIPAPTAMGRPVSLSTAENTASMGGRSNRQRRF